ncbi:MAG: hypothetical protein HY650_02230 [Acidobacteria bacterium]|nr:hypothetical protein [Acidobacteriota bacterium]
MATSSFEREWRDWLVEKAARLCHQVNKGYCEALGDTSQLDWEMAPDWQKESARQGVILHLEAIRSGPSVSPSASHEAWLKLKTAEGWQYGPVKDPEKKEHPCCVPFEELPAEQKAKDYIFAAVVKAYVWGELMAVSAPQRGLGAHFHTNV